MWGDSGGVLLEGSYVDATLQQINRQGRWKFGGGGTSDLCGVLPPGAEYGEMPGYRLSGSSA